MSKTFTNVAVIAIDSKLVKQISLEYNAARSVPRRRKEFKVITEIWFIFENKLKFGIFERTGAISWRAACGACFSLSTKIIQKKWLTMMKAACYT